MYITLKVKYYLGKNNLSGHFQKRNVCVKNVALKLYTKYVFIRKGEISSAICSNVCTVKIRSRLQNDPFMTISSHFFANYMYIFRFRRSF